MSAAQDTQPDDRIAPPKSTRRRMIIASVIFLVGLLLLAIFAGLFLEGLTVVEDPPPLLQDP